MKPKSRRTGNTPACKGEITTYKCLDCGSVFTEPSHYYERHGLETPPYEEMWVCPFYGGAYAEAAECDSCGEFVFADTTIERGWDTFCPACAKEAGLLDE